ncbi:hypothetical protein KIN20_021970 [Parelaphostrongylus tenuis]|uniref:Peptidase M13 N-terminal domain-containing protein n=1 Tax=Parelaphostrongylus tenuis TaxID=148309 RepID=A0AAD5MQ00_PARTN|nr:hypothetical protein KIN20_021970 [Parelaphostrongylus tenuis]
METHRVFQAVICLVLLIVTIATLGVTIAILVTMINNENKSSDSDSSSSGSANKVNVPLPKQISTGNENYYGYKDAVELFKNHLNATVSPCDDFYLYTCGNYTASMSFDMSDNANMENMVDQLTNMSYVSSSPEPVKQVAWYFQQCVNARLNWTDLVKDGKVVMNAINRVAKGNESSPEETRFPFYMLHQNETVKEFPNSKGLGFLFGYTSGGEGASNLLTPLTDTNWTNPHGNNGYAFFIDQPSTLLPYTYHTKAWDFFQNQLFARIVRTMLLLAKTQKIQLDMPTLVADAKEIVRFDHLLATKYSTDDTTRRNYTRSYNPMTIDELSKTYPSIDWHTFLLNALIKARNVSEYVLGNASYQYIVMEPDKLRMLNNNLGSQSFVSSRTIINYIYCHVVDANLEYLPWKQGFLKSINHFSLSVHFSEGRVEFDKKSGDTNDGNTMTPVRLS